MDEWKHLLDDHWDQQLLQFLELGFPGGFNRACQLQPSLDNHNAALHFPTDDEKYLEEKIENKAVETYVNDNK